MSPTLALAPRLALERLRDARGGAMLDILAVIAFVVSAFLALTVAGGTWMFVQRWRHRPAQIQDALGLDGLTVTTFLQGYVVLAMVACALLVVPVLNLGAAAARLGAHGRARRLASLRLVGMSGRQVVAMSTAETLVQAAAGALLGTLLWLVSVPAWHLMSFQGVAISTRELLMPWWLVLAVIAVLLALAALSTVIGLQQVRISPLGVAMQESPKALRRWRLGAFVIAVAAFAVFGQLFTASVGNIEFSVYAVLVVMILIVVGAVNLVGPWVLQILARPGVVTGSVSRLVASRRIIDDPRAAWRNVAAVSLLGMVAAFVALLPTDPSTFGGDATANVLLVGDLRTGAIITLAVGLVVAATSTLINQGALVLDRSSESVAMDRAGVPRRVFAAIRRYHVLIPLIVTLLISVGVGVLLGTPFMTVFQFEVSGVLIVLATVAAGLGLTLAAAEACRPLQRRVLDHVARRND